VVELNRRLDYGQAFHTGSPGAGLINVVTADDGRVDHEHRACFLLPPTSFIVSGKSWPGGMNNMGSCGLGL